jgi:hypothetical protein
LPIKRFILFSLIAVVIAAAGFAGGWFAALSRPAPPQPEPPAPSPAKASLKAHPLWGMTLGSKRVYVDAAGNTETMTVEKIRIEKDRVVFGLETVDHNGAFRDYKEVFQNADGIWHVGMGDGPDGTGPYQRYLKLPCKEDEVWSPNRFHWSPVWHTCQGTERVAVPAGTFDTIKVSAVLSHPLADRLETYWYNLEHGLIQYRVQLESSKVITLDRFYKLASLR